MKIHFLIEHVDFPSKKAANSLICFSKKLRKQKGLQRFVYVNRWGGASIDYSDPKALEELTRSLLAEFYQITWRLPDGSLAHLGLQHAIFFLVFVISLAMVVGCRKWN